MRIAGIIKNSVVNGIGIRDVLFLQGCTHHCEGCHNPGTWDLNGGQELSVPEVMRNFAGSKRMTISGGEPLLQFEHILDFMRFMNFEYGTRFWLYTGFNYEDIPYWKLQMLAKYVDVLVDGKFEIDKKDLTLRFRGSSNQRLIDLPKTVGRMKVVLWEEENEEFR